jgi:cholesterol transport system auxiliary component
MSANTTSMLTRARSLGRRSRQLTYRAPIWVDRLRATRVRGVLMRCAGALAAVGTAVALAGCDVKLPGEGPPPRLFTLNAKTTFDTDLPTVNWQLIIEMPSAPASLDTVRIAVQRSPLNLDYYASAAWTDRVPSMIQTLLISSFENTGKIVAVGRESVGLRADFLLKTDIRNFEVEYVPEGASPRVHIVAKLIKMPEREIIADRTCDYKQPASSDQLEQIVESYNDVLGRCMRRIVEWTLRTGASYKPRS